MHDSRALVPPKARQVFAKVSRRAASDCKCAAGSLLARALLPTSRLLRLQWAGTDMGNANSVQSGLAESMQGNTTVGEHLLEMEKNLLILN